MRVSLVLLTALRAELQNEFSSVGTENFISTIILRTIKLVFGEICGKKIDCGGEIIDFFEFYYESIDKAYDYRIVRKIVLEVEITWHTE